MTADPLRPLAGQVALVTGAAGDMGRAIAVALAGAGARLVLTDRRSEADAQPALDAVAAAGSQPTHYERADVADRPAVDALVAGIDAREGRLDLVVSNAGIVDSAPFLDVTPAQWQAHLNSNLTGCFHIGQAAARLMVARGTPGAILFTGSWVQDVPWPEISAYCASKGGLKMLTRCMARELARHHIRVNIVAPGIVNAGLAGRQLRDEPQYAARVRHVIPLGGPGTPEQVAQAMLYLAGPTGAYITGTTLLIDGGCSLFQFSET
ncbi:MAG: SDR family oxidoreductase [Chloroflexi bacterium]|nr:SDR family oxidoreductase [Chloroflexota bacterium]